MTSDKLIGNRRWFFKTAATAVAFVPLGSRDRRISCVKGDPGERLYGVLMADDYKIVVYLNGVEQKFVATADEGLGYVVRAVVSPDGNIAINYSTNEIIEETVYGDVRITVTKNA